MTIRKIELTDTDNFFNLIEKNRIHLLTYFPITLKLTSDLWSTNKFIEDKITKFANKENFYFAVEIESKLIGAVSIKEIDWTVPKCEIAYFVDKDHQGKGITKKAVKWLTKFCFVELEMEKIYAKINPENFASKHVLERNGFVKEGTLKNDYRNGNNILTDSDYYGLLRQKQNASR